MGNCLSIENNDKSFPKSNRDKSYNYEVTNISQNNSESQQIILSAPLPQQLISSSPISPVVFNQRPTVRALFSYEARHTDDLEFSKGDLMYISSDMSEAWWLALHATTKKQGYIPSNYVVLDDGSPSSHEGWYEITHKEADKKLLRMGNPVGTYIIRPCSGMPSSCFLFIHFNFRSSTLCFVSSTF